MTGAAHVCPICAGSESVLLDRRSQVPVLQNRVYCTREAAVSCIRGDLEIRGCLNCSFVWNRHFDESLVAYNPDYENNQLMSAVFEQHVRSRAQAVIDAVSPDERLRLVEAGCGQGDFIRLVAEMAGDRLEWAVGLDPALREESGREKIRLRRAFFDSAYSHGMAEAPNVVISRHTIEHIGCPLDFLRALHYAMPEKGCRLFIETPCFLWILRERAFEDLFYEHCSLFSPSSMARAMASCGFRVTGLRHVFGEQYLWVEAEPGGDGPAAVEGRSPATEFRAFAAARDDFVRKWRRTIDSFRKEHLGQGIALWGAGAKGVTFAQMVGGSMADQDCAAIDGLIDINPKKQGFYSAGTALPVLSPAQAAKAGIALAIIMNSNYTSEIREFCESAGLAIGLMGIDEFGRGSKEIV